MALRSYKVSKSSQILTMCPFYKCTIGGYYCVNCTAFLSKDMQTKTVHCKRNQGTYENILPPQRKKKSNQ